MRAQHLVSEPRWSTAPRIAAASLGSRILEKLDHVSVIEFPRMRLYKVVIDDCEPKTNAVSFHACIDAIQIAHAAVRGERRNGARGDRKRASLGLAPILGQSSIAGDVGGALSARANPPKHPIREVTGGET